MMDFTNYRFGIALRCRVNWSPACFALSGPSKQNRHGRALAGDAETSSRKRNGRLLGLSVFGRTDAAR